jgi:1-acyl-sn-glycerol-3-phosphate acyltransferase
VVYRILKVVIGAYLRLFFKVKIVGVENVPEHGAAILAANHQAFCDSLFIPFAVPRRVTFVAKAEYFEQRRTAWFFRAVGQIPMHRGGGEKSEKSLDEAIDLLRSGGVLGIYPEGTRAPDERLYRGRTGVARLALAADCPIIPVGVVGTRAVQPIGARLMRPFRPVEVRIGAPVDVPARYGQRRDDPMVCRRITDEVMFEIRELSGQEYVDKYASRAPAAETASYPGAGAASSSGGNGRGSASSGAAAHPRERATARVQPA